MRVLSKYRALVEIGNIVNSTLDLDTLLDLVMKTITKALRADASSLLLFEEDGNLYFRTATGEKREEIKKYKLRLGEGIGGWVVKERKPLLVPDVLKDGRYKREIGEQIGFEARSIICVPLISDDASIGAVEVINGVTKAPFSQEDLDFLLAISDQIAQSIRNAKMYSVVRKECESLKEILGLKHNIVGDSPQIREILVLIGKIAKIDVGVLITGETGVGKEMVARVIHENSKRATGPFVAVNCAAIPDTLLESELFGHEKGAFTGAVLRKVGKFELAHGGTLFLDEVGDLSLQAQAKVLRAIQEKRIERLGGTRPIPVDIRIIAATNQDLTSYIQAGKFREDLFYRLNEIDIFLPPLRERREDIPLLIDHFIKIFNQELGKSIKRVSGLALEAFLNYGWRGNIRELKNVLKKVMALMDGDIIRLEDLPADFQPHFEAPDEIEERDMSLETAIKKHIIKVLKYTKGNKSQAAEFLNISRPRLDRKILLHHIKV